MWDSALCFLASTTVIDEPCSSVMYPRAPSGGKTTPRGRGPVPIVPFPVFSLVSTPGLFFQRERLAGPAGRDLDHGGLPRFLVRHVEELAIGREVEAFGILSTRDRAQQLFGRDIHDRDAVGGPIGGKATAVVDARWF